MSIAVFRTNYMDNALDPDGLRDILAKACAALKDIDFDTIVGTGFSGGVVIPALAMALDKNFALIRKESDDSHHGPGKILGHIGQRWIFVDDFISTGGTRRRVLDKVEEACENNEGRPRSWNPYTLQYETPTPHVTTYVGDYTYINFDKPGWTPAEETA